MVISVMPSFPWNVVDEIMYSRSVGNTRVPLKLSGNVYPVKILPFALHIAGDGAGSVLSELLLLLTSEEDDEVVEED